MLFHSVYNCWCHIGMERQEIASDRMKPYTAYHHSKLIRPRGCVDEVILPLSGCFWEALG
eukprot:1041317-Amphidinium_carterae.1